MSMAEKLKTVAENVPKVYEAGQKSEYDRFWDAFQDYGNRKNYCQCFCGFGWTNETFKPKYDIKPTTGAYGLFWNSRIEGDLVEILDNLGVKLDFSGFISGDYIYLFGSTQFTRIGVCDFSNAVHPTTKLPFQFGQLFWNTSSLVTIDKVIVNGHGFSNLSFSCSNLTNLTIEGTIGLDSAFSSCYKLTHDSLMSIINALADYSEDTSGTTYTLTLGTTNLAKLTDAEKAIATERGWTLA